MIGFEVHENLGAAFSQEYESLPVLPVVSDGRVSGSLDCHSDVLSDKLKSQIYHEFHDAELELYLYTTITTLATNKTKKAADVAPEEGDDNRVGSANKHPGHLSERNINSKNKNSTNNKKRSRQGDGVRREDIVVSAFLVYIKSDRCLDYEATPNAKVGSDPFILPIGIGEKLRWLVLNMDEYWKIINKTYDMPKNTVLILLIE